MTAAMVHDASATSLALELAAALAASLVAGRAVARLPAAWFLAVLFVVAGLFLPVLGIVLVGPAAGAAAALAFLLLPLLAWGWRRCPAGERREARRLGAPAFLVLRVLVLPALAPLAGAALVIAVALLACRWSLGAHPAPILVPYPAVETG